MQHRLNHLTKPKCRIIQKYIHEWLPLKMHYQVHSVSTTKLCPSCQQTEETAKHFLQCNHLKCAHQWEEMYELIQKASDKAKIPNHIHSQFTTGLRHSCQPTPTTQILNNIPASLATQAQAKLRWKQLYYGWFSQMLLQAIYHHNPDIPNLRYLSKIISIIWSAVIQIWHICNCHLHPQDNNTNDQSQLRMTIENILYKANQHPTLEQTIQRISIDCLMTQTTCQINQWIAHSAQHLHDDNKQSYKEPPYTHITSMSTFLQQPRLSQTPTTRTSINYFFFKQCGS